MWLVVLKYCQHELSDWLGFGNNNYLAMKGYHREKEKEWACKIGTVIR